MANESDPANTQKALEEARDLISNGQGPEATAILKLAYARHPHHPDVLSYYGLCEAVYEGNHIAGIHLCTEAVRKNRMNTDYYINLAKAYEASGNKRAAISTLSQGLKVETRSHKLRQAMRSLSSDQLPVGEMLSKYGARNPPPLTFLHRDHVINKYVGLVTRRYIPKLFRPGRNG